jgi:hypothetical protein
MQKTKLECSYVIGKFEKHDELKSQLLNLINTQFNVNRLVDDDDNTDISRCDWRFNQDQNRKWTQVLLKDLSFYLSDLINELGYKSFTIRELWFQQYDHNSQHSWHVHGCNWTNVYFLDLPEGTPKTQLISPFDQTTPMEFDVKEGDILTFPSFVIHRAPTNISNTRKTIISWNMDTDIK